MFVQKGIQTFLEVISKRALKEQGSTTFYQSGVRYAPCNGVFEKEQARVPTLEEIARVTDQMDGLPFIWWSGASTLEKAGFLFGGDLTGIEMEIQGSLESTTLEVRRAQHPKEIKLFTEVAVKGFEMDPSLVPSLAQANTDERMIHLMAYIDGRPIGTVTVLMGKDGVGIWNLAVLQECRRKGIGYQLVKEGLREAQKRGYKSAMAILMPDKMASTLLTQLGFQEVSKHPFYIHAIPK